MTSTIGIKYGEYAIEDRLTFMLDEGIEFTIYRLSHNIYLIVK
jgi:hypothetical protein